MFQEIIIFFLFFLVIIEVILYFLINNFKTNFKWILTIEDELPKFNNKKLKYFFNNSYDPVLGWDRKKNTNGSEISNTKTYFKISKYGFRGNTKFKKNSISVFGDSFAFCRYVNDNETWENYLDKYTKFNILNFGVGNYGLDQSYLKYLKYKKKINSKIVIFNFVPETIARVHSYWKHYREFGNIRAFKPLINIKNNKLHLIKTRIKKNFSERQIHKEIKNIKKNDIFYEEKFKKHIFQFPYTLSLIRNLEFYSKILINLSFYNITKNKNYYNNAVSVVLNKNIVESHLMYSNKFFKNELKKLILFMDKKISQENKKMVIVVSPQLLDIEKNSSDNYIQFYKDLSKKIHCCDLTKYFKKNIDYKKLYFKDIYGGHFNKKGNKFIALKIFNFLKKKKLI
tara:strand:- start:571 stop:1764 length:1194 start_codon:yes stop_codon:yes gene_type:complete